MASKPNEQAPASLTKAEIAIRIAAAEEKRVKHERINNAERLKASGLRIVHILPRNNGNLYPRDRLGMTVAYRPVFRRPSVIEVSTALCRKGDVFSRKMGTKTAIENFQNGHTVFIPATNPGRDPVWTVRDTFGH